jgi:hypothetical protein
MQARTEELAVEFDQDGVQVRSAEWGDMHVAEYALSAGTDLAPFFAALPDGLCSCDHWGSVVEGEIHLRYADGSEETTRAGEVYHWPAGHTGWTDHGVVFVACTPLEAIRRMERQMASAG